MELNVSQFTDKCISVIVSICYLSSPPLHMTKYAMLLGRAESRKDSCKVLLGNIIKESVNEQNGDKRKRIFNGIFKSPEGTIKVIAADSLIYNNQEKTKDKKKSKTSINQTPEYLN